MQEENHEESLAMLVAETAPSSGERLPGSYDGEQRVAAHFGAASSADQAATQQALDELDRRIRDLEAAMGDMRTVTAAAQQPPPAGRKTAGHASQLLSKAGETTEGKAGSIDAALRSLSPEQRIAVKSGLLRAGVL